MDALLIVLVLLLLFGAFGGVYTSRPGWTGPDVGGFLWLLVAVILLVLVLRALGVL
jgi:hypothetical protein